MSEIAELRRQLEEVQRKREAAEPRTAQDQAQQEQNTDKKEKAEQATEDVLPNTLI